MRRNTFAKFRQGFVNECMSGIVNTISHGKHVGLSYWKGLQALPRFLPITALFNESKVSKTKSFMSFIQLEGCMQIKTGEVHVVQEVKATEKNLMDIKTFFSKSSHDGLSIQTRQTQDGRVF